MAKTSKLRPYLAAAIVNLTCLSYGVSIGWMSPAAPALQSEHPPLGGDKALSDSSISWLGSLLFLGGVLGVFFWGQATERFGRKMTGYLVSLPLLVGWTTVLFAQNEIWLFVGRFIVGMGGSGSMVLVPSYVSDISEDSNRGTLGSFILFFFNLGVVTAYFVGSVMSLQSMTLFCGCIPIVFLILYYFLPESPVYLWTKGKKKQAREALLWFRSENHETVEKELSVLDSLISSSKSSVPIRRLYDNKETIKAMTISLSLSFFQQFCGILMILTYTSIILIKSGMDFSPHTATVIIGLVQLIASWADTLIIDRIDRKVLLIVQSFGMAFTLFVIGIFFYLQNSSEYFLPTWIPFIFICFNVIVYSAAASHSYVITSEIVVPEIRPLAFSVLIFWGTIMAFISIKIYSFLVENFYMYGTFWFFASWSLMSGIFTILFVPETRGKSLVEILRIFNGEKVENRCVINRTEYVEVPVTEKK